MTIKSNIYTTIKYTHIYYLMKYINDSRIMKSRSKNTSKYHQNRSPFYDKHRAYRNNSSEESEDNTMNPSFPDLSNLLKADKKKVFRDHNHIYFRCKVTMDHVNKLCNLIEEYNREQDLMRSDITTAIIIPKPIYLHITSMGGDLLGGFLAYDYIKNSKIPVYTIAEGYTVSSGANMFMAGRKRFMTENSYILVHQLNVNKYGTETFHDMIDNTVNIVDFMSKTYAIYLNNIRHHKQKVPYDDILTKEKLENHMLHDIYWNYETCARFGIADGLYTNYTDIDINDIKSVIQYEENTFTAPKIYSLRELAPSKKVVDKIKINMERDKQDDPMNMIKSLLSSKCTTDDMNGLINNNINKRKIDDLSDNNTPDTTRRSTRQIKRRKTNLTSTPYVKKTRTIPLRK
jgi:ATP-dependent protease ClpP protease subunit